MSDAPVVGSAAFELRVERDKAKADMAQAKREIEAEARKTEAALSEIIGSGAQKGGKKAVEALKETGAQGARSGQDIRDAMAKAGAEIGEAVERGSRKARRELDALQQKMREVQQTQRAWVPDDAYRRDTAGGIESARDHLRRVSDQRLAARDAAAARQRELHGSTSTVPAISAPEVKRTADETKKLAENLGEIKPAAETASEGLGKISARAGASALTIAALVGGLLLATKTLFDMGRAAMKTAGEIADTATRIGIGTSALQEWRHVAVSAGADAGSADRALTSFSQRLALAGSKLSKEAVKDFAALRITPEQIKSFKSTEEALDVVIDRISSLGSESDRIAMAERMQLGPFTAAIRKGSDEVARLRDEARRLGVVMSAEVVARGAAAQAQFETLSRVVGVELKSAFIDLAPAIVTAISLVAELARSLGDALDQWRDLDAKTTRGVQRRDQSMAREQKALIDRYGSPDAMRGQTVLARPVGGAQYSPRNPLAAVANAPRLPSAQRDPALNLWENLGRNSSQVFNAVSGVDAFEHWQALNAARVENATEMVNAARGSRPPNRDDRPGNTLIIPPGRADNSAQRAAEQEARRVERVEQELYRARIRVLGIADQEALTVQERYELERRQVLLEREAEEKELKSRKARGDINAQEYTQLETLRVQTSALEDRVAADILARDLADERLAQERLLSDLTTDLLSIQSSAARTARQRRDIELRLLDMAERRAVEDMERSKDFRQTTPERQQEVRDELRRIFAGRREAVGRQNQTPLEAWRDSLLRDAAEVDEAMEGIAARGLDALNAGLVDAMLNTRSLGDVFSNVARQIIADLASIAIRQHFTAPLAGLLFGGSGGAGILPLRRASGGLVNGPGGPTGDAIPALLSDGEFVIKSASVRKHLNLIRAINADSLPRFANGGLVGAMASMQGVPSDGIPKPQRIYVEVGVNDDRFNAYVDGRAAPIAAQAAGAAYGQTQCQSASKRDPL